MHKYINIIGESSPPFQVHLLGGKGQKLTELSWLKYNIPSGFIILTSCFKTFLKENPKLELFIKNYFTQNKLDEPSAIEKASKTIRSQFLDYKIPKLVTYDIIDYFDKLNTDFVSVRSSATLEDGTKNSFAGQFESYLNVKRESLLDYIKLCWSSLFTARSIAYRLHNNLSLYQVEMAVVIQTMIDSDLSGVAFTKHPVTNNKNQIVIDVVYGLGEALVSGEVTPSSYIINKNTLNVITKDIVVQHKKFVRNKNGSKNIWAEIKSEENNLPKLDERMLLEIAKVGKDLENIEGVPCDIEWAISSNMLYILQCRPITH
jgi:pyruvate, water dikinase